MTGWVRSLFNLRDKANDKPKPPQSIRRRFVSNICKQEQTNAHAVFEKRLGRHRIEYALIASLVSVAIVVAVTALGTKLTSTYTGVSNSLK